MPDLLFVSKDVTPRLVLSDDREGVLAHQRPQRVENFRESLDINF